MKNKEANNNNKNCKLAINSQNNCSTVLLHFPTNLHNSVQNFHLCLLFKYSSGPIKLYSVITSITAGETFLSAWAITHNNYFCRLVRHSGAVTISESLGRYWQMLQTSVNLTSRQCSRGDFSFGYICVIFAISNVFL